MLCLCSGFEFNIVQFLSPSSSPESKGNHAYLEGEIVHSWVITVGLRQLHVPCMEFWAKLLAAQGRISQDVVNASTGPVSLEVKLAGGLLVLPLLPP